MHVHHYCNARGTEWHSGLRSRSLTERLVAESPIGGDAETQLQKSIPGSL